MALRLSRESYKYGYNYGHFIDEDYEIQEH